MGDFDIGRNAADNRGWVGKDNAAGVGMKIFVPFFLVTFSVIGLISYMAINIIHKKIENMVIQRATVVLNNTVERFGEQARFLEIYARSISEYKELEEAIIRRDNREIKKVLVPAKTSYGLDQLFLYEDPRNPLVSLMSSGDTVKSNQSELIARALKNSTTSGYWITANGLDIYAATPVHFEQIAGEAEVPVGALIARIYYHDKQLNEIKAKEGAEINIIFAGRLVNSTLGKEAQLKLLPGLMSAVQKGQNFQNVATNNDIDYINAWKKIGNQGIISVMVPYDDLIAVSRGFSRDISRLTFMIILLVFLTSLVLTKLMIQPLVKMLDITTAITHGDFSQRIKVSSRDEFGRLGEAINYMADTIKERIEAAEYQAVIDGLTGLYNHRYFQQRLQEELEKAERYKSFLSLAILDIDYFKHYNDTQGHPAGDKVLKQISGLITENIRVADVAARYGGEEFALILIATGPEEAVSVTERIRQAVENYRFEGSDRQPAGKMTISAGVASYPVNANSKDELIKMADDALYKAKYISKNKVVLYYSVLDELKKDLDVSEQELVNTVKTLISVINSKDKYTYGHSERVVQYAAWIAQAMGLPDQEIRNLKMGAYLHDIGKIEIDRELLNKRETLSADEKGVLMQHPQWGAQIISPVKSLGDVVPIILHHHEKFDGSGYPGGLKGTDIPLAARILKVADSFDAMTTARPYREEKSFAEAAGELKRCAGIDFDPEVVQIFLGVLRKLDIS